MSKIIYSESFIEFLRNSECKIAKILYRLHKKRYDSLILVSDEINFLTFRNDGTISYLPAGKELKHTDDGNWAREGRQSGRPSKIIRKIINKRVWKFFKDSDFECFANAYKSNFNENGYKFELLDHDQIPSVYEMDRGDGAGSINNSCMNGDSNYLDIYKNCEKLQILILKNKDGLLCGRSLIWQISEDITLMDRIYISQDFMYDKFLSFAKTYQYWTKKDFKSYDNKTTFINLLGQEINKIFTVHTDTDFAYYPYIDTFQCGNDGSLSNSENGQYIYNETGGTRSDNHEGEIYDDINEEYIHEDNAVYIESGERQYRDSYCHINNCIQIGNEWYYENDCNIIEVGNTYYTIDSDELCEIGGDYHLMEDCVYSDMDNAYYLMEDCVYSDMDNTYYLMEDCVYAEEIKDNILKSESVKINGDYYHEDSENIIDIDGTYYTIYSDELCEIDGDYYLTSSSEVIFCNDTYILAEVETN